MTKPAAAAGKVAVKGTLTWLKWAIPAAVALSGAAGAYVWSRPVPKGPAPGHVAPAPSPKSSAKPRSDALVQELSLLRAALAASRSGNAARALELSREHAKRYPSSRLGIARSSIEVRSLCALGRVSEARQVAEQLGSQAPSSPVTASLKDTCVGK